MEVYEGVACTPGEGKIAIVVSKFNRSITDNLLKGALAKLKEYSVSDESITVAWVPGAFELPHVAQRFALDTEYQAVICLGCVIKGETSHDEHINRAVSLEIARISAEFGIPIAFGLLTCNTKEQAIARSGMNESERDKAINPTPGNKGAEAAEAVLEMLHLLEILPPLEDDEEEFPASSFSGEKFTQVQDTDNFVSDFGAEDGEDEDEDGSEAGWYMHAGSDRSGQKTFTGKKDYDRPKDKKDGKGHFHKGSDRPYKGGSNKGGGYKGGSGKGHFGGKKPKK